MATNLPAKDDSSSGTVVSAGLMDKFHAYMLDRARNNNSDDRSTEILAGQAERILTAETEDAIWDADTGGTVQCRDVPGLMVEIRSLEPVISNRADIDNSHGYYLSMDATVIGGPEELLAAQRLQIGEVIPLQTSAELLMFKIRAFEAHNMLPIRTLLKGTRTQSGNTVLKWERMPRMAQSGNVG